MEAMICDAIRTPIGKYGGKLATVRTDDLAAIPIKALIERNPDVDWSCVDDVIFGSANQAGEDNRNVARMAVLLAGLPNAVPATTINRLCASGMDAFGMAARGIRSGDYDLVISGGVESMSRAPFVLPKSDTPFNRNMEIYDTTIGWRFVNPEIRSNFGTDSMPETAENVALEFEISRDDQDAYAIQSQTRWNEAQNSGLFGDEVVPVKIPSTNGEMMIVEVDEHPRPGTSVEKLSKLRGINGNGSTVTAGNASGVNDGSAALILSGESSLKKHGLTPMARFVGMCAAGVEPRIMGIGPVSATKKLLERTGLKLDQMDVIELNEAFASQCLATLRQLGLPDDSPHVNANGGAIALGHPLGMSGSRLVLTAAYQLKRTGGQYALCTMCVGVGQGVATIIERV